MAPRDPRHHGRGGYLPRNRAHRVSVESGNGNGLLGLCGVADLRGGCNVDAGWQVGVAQAPGHDLETAGVTAMCFRVGLRLRLGGRAPVKGGYRSALAAPTTHTTSSSITRANLPPRS